MKASTPKDAGKGLVVIHHKHPFTNTLAIAEGVGLEHPSVIKLVRKHQKAFEELGLVRFQIAPRAKGKHGGGDVEYAELNEDQATFLMTLFRNSETVLQFKLKLVKAFRAAIKEIERLSKQAGDPNWRLIRDETKLGFKWMNETLQEKRAEIGKETAAHHYSNEVRLINAVLTNRFAGLERNALSADDLRLMSDLQRYNAMLIAQNLPYPQRKTLLADRAVKKLAATVSM